jgi:hypothetical protein
MQKTHEWIIPVSNLIHILVLFVVHLSGGSPAVPFNKHNFSRKNCWRTIKARLHLQSDFKQGIAVSQCYLDKMWQACKHTQTHKLFCRAMHP